MSINLQRKKLNTINFLMFVKQVHFYYKQKKYHLAFLSLKVFLESRGESKYFHFLYTVKQKNIFRKSLYTLKQSIQIKEMQNHSTSCSLSHALMQLPTAFFIRHRVFLVSDRMKRLPAI